MIKLIRLFTRSLGFLVGMFWVSKLSYFIYLLKRELVTGFTKHTFKSFGKNSLLGLQTTIINPKYISIGDNSSITNRVVLSCFESVKSVGHLPEIIIGNNVSIGEDCHITCANKLIIGNGVLTGKNVLITDNAHGDIDLKTLNVPPLKREVTSKGPVIIEDNVWIGEKASIMPNVHIGKGAIIAANAVVTKNAPAYAVVGGNPARILKQL